MHTLVRTVFARLHSLDPISEEAKLQMTGEDTQEGEIKLTVAANGGPTNISASEANGDEQEVAVDVSTIHEKRLDADEAELQASSVTAGPKLECGSSASYMFVLLQIDCI